MKNRVLIGVLTVILVIGMVSCSMDEYAKLGEAMGKMGNNVYGIEPNMQKVNETTKKFDDKVTKNEATGKVEVELVPPADLISSVAEIKNATKKTEELKKQLDEPLAKDGVSGGEIQKALKEKVDEIISEATKNVDEEALKNADEKLQSAYQSVKQALDDIKESITDNPTKADLATVSIIKDLATTVSDIASNPDDYMKDGELDTEKIIEDANKALQALDALKVTSTAADLDILKDFNLASLFSSKAYMEKDAGVLEDEDLAKRFEDFEKFFNDVDLSNKYVEHLKHSAVAAVNTAAVILVDSGFDLKIIEKAGFKPEDGKSYGEELEKAFENLKNELGKNN